MIVYDSKIWLIVVCDNTPLRNKVISEQSIPSYPELEVEWLPSSGAVCSGVLKSLPGCACGAMLVDDWWKQGQMASLLQK